MDDAALLHAYHQARSEEAFRELVRRHLPVVYAAARRQVNRDAHLAHDVAQRVFISLARKSGSLTRHASILGWLYTATRFEAARAVRTEQRRRRREEHAAAMNSLEPEDASFDDIAPLLDDAMAELGDTEREAVLLRFFSGRSFGEIGRVLRISEEAARKRVDRALEKLQQSLGRRGFTSSAVALGSALSSHAAPPVLPSVATAVTAGACAQLAASHALSLGLFMTSTKTLALLVGVAFTAGAWFWHDRQAALRSEQELAGARAELATAEAQLARRSAELATAQREATDAEKAESATVRAVASAAPAAVPAYLTDSGYRELARASSQARRHLEFQRLYRQLGLTPAQIAEFETLMARQDEAQIDAAVARAAGQDEQTVFKRSGPEWSQGMKRLLGDEGFKQLQAYLRSMPVRSFIDRFAVQSSSLGDPISPEQADQLAALALAKDTMYQQGKGTDPGTVNWNDVWDPAAKLLSHEQLAHLQRTVEVWTLQKQLSLRLKKEGARP